MNWPASCKHLMVTGHQRVELVEGELKPPPPGAMGGPTLCTLISPGTELASAFCATEGFPRRFGYAAVSRVEQLSGEARDAGIREGDIRLSLGNHRAWQYMTAEASVPVPPGLDPAEALIARLVGVSMTTLMTTTARPGDTVLVIGVGPVGFLCAQIFHNAAYRVIAIDPDETRRHITGELGIEVFANLTDAAPSLTPKPGLCVDCSGHEAPIVQAAKLLRRRGELVLVGVPWMARSNILAHDLLHAVFHNYVVLRSGWEWELPLQTSDFAPHSIFSGLTQALKWLAAGKIHCRSQIELNAPADAHRVYTELVQRKREKLFQVFDWRR